MALVEIYTKNWCSYSRRAKQLLDRKQVSYVEYDVTDDTELEALMRARAGRHTVPQIFVDDVHIGGFDDLAALDADGGLDPMLEGLRQGPGLDRRRRTLASAVQEVQL